MGKSINPGKPPGVNTGDSIKGIPDILEENLQNVIADWLARVDNEPELASIAMSYEDRTGHLPQLLRDVIARLRLDEETSAPVSEAAAHHGDLRSRQGYTVAMAVEESRLLQVSIFSMLHKSQQHLEFNEVLPGVVIIADEVDAQLKQQMLRFMAAADLERSPKFDSVRPKTKAGNL